MKDDTVYLEVGGHNDEKRLDRWLKISFGRVTQSRIEVLCRKGKIRVNDLQVRPSHRVVRGDKVYIIGGESGEIDHLISIFLLIPSKSFFENIIWLYGDKKIIFRQKIELNIKKLTKFSIIPLSDLTNLSIDGAEWNLDNKDIQFGETLTLRNSTNEEQLNIRCDKGVFALIY